MSAPTETAAGFRYSWGGDEFLFVEVAEEMDLAANFRAAALCQRLAADRPAGIIDICPSNASLLLRFDPDVLAPDVLLARVRELATETADLAGQVLSSRLIEVPVWYDDPFTNEVGERFRDNRHEPDSTDLDFAATQNGLASRAEFISRHHSAPWIVTMVGFVAGLPFMYQMVPRAEQLEVPKYLLPRTDTPKLTIGHGGCFSCIYSVRGAGGYQMFGVAAAPIYDPRQTLADFADSAVLFRPGDVVTYTPVTEERYREIQAEVAAGTWRYDLRPVTVDLAAAVADPRAYNERLLEAPRVP
ncbi:MAG: allophanate hydrolase [Modestobacter sp.]|jgi:urea carboxylase|nr:allophanate hydrolase [Modestobacter sp.]HEV7726973.1 allophanate hydrolase subunit 1 [Modestobacter sp.]